MKYIIVMPAGEPQVQVEAKGIGVNENGQIVFFNESGDYCGVAPKDAVVVEKQV